jgi:hypothetical protein
MPHMLAESAYPGTVDEKIGYEVATYAWLQENCPDIPIPHLWGFGFTDGRKVRSATILLPLVLISRTISSPTYITGHCT